MLSVNFLGNAPISAANLPDTPLGSMGGFAPIEPFIRVNPEDPANLAPTSHIGTRISTDGGATFAATDFFPNPPGTNVFNGDTGNVFDADGRLFWANMAGTGTAGIAVAQINPTTGTAISTRALSNSNDDKPFITADTGTLSPYINNLYVIWTRFSGTVSGFPEVFLSRSVDHGLTWSVPLQLSDATQHGFVWPTGVSVGPNGEVYVAFHANGTFGSPFGNNGRVVITRSYDGGQTFGTWVDAISPGNADISANVQTQPGTIPSTQFWMQGAAQPWMLTDAVRITNAYVVTNDDPDNFFGSGDDGDIAFSRSIDGGGTWLTSYLPTSAAFGTLQIFPAAAIDEFGNIVVAWYDNRRGFTNGSGRYLFDVMATYSVDGGTTWAPDFMVNDPAQPFDPDPGASIRFAGPPPTTRIGEYFGIDLFGGTAHVVWNGNTYSGATPIGQQVWYSQFEIPGSLVVSDTIINADNVFVIQDVPGNSDWFEVRVDGQRQYAGIKTAINNITLVGLDGNDTFNVSQISWAMPLVSIFGGPGSDLLNIGNGNLDDMSLTAVHFDGGSDFDSVVVHDQTIGLGRGDPYAFGNNNMTRTGFPGINFFDTESFTLNAQDGNNTIEVRDSLVTTFLTLNAGPGFDSVYLGTVQTNQGVRGPVTVNGGSGADHIRIGENSGLLSVSNGVTVNAGGDTNDTIWLVDHGPIHAANYVVTATTVSATFFGGLVYSGISDLLVTCTLGNNTVDINGTAPGVRTTVSGFPGSDIINVNETAPGSPAYVIDGFDSAYNDQLTINSDNSGNAEAIFYINTFPSPARFTHLLIGAGGKMTFDVPPLAAALVVNNLSMASTSQLDLKDRALILDYCGTTQLTAVQNLLSSGYNSGAWNGNGINSSTAAADPSKAVGYAEATDLFTTFPASFGGRQVDNTSILIRSTLEADADLDKDVDLDDFNRLASNFGTAAKRWSQGNFNYDPPGNVDLDDFNDLASNFGQSLGSVGTVSTSGLRITNSGLPVFRDNRGRERPLEALLGRDPAEQTGLA